MVHYWTRGLVAFFALLLVASGCGPGAPRAEPAARGEPTASASIPSASAPSAVPAAPGPEPATVHVGVLSILAEAGLYVALERGYFREEGLAAEFITFDTGAKAIPALATGQVEVSGGALSPGFINATQRGVGVKIVASLSHYEPGYHSGYFLLRKDLADRGEIRDWADLRGRRIAVPPGRPTVGDYTVARGLQQGGLTLADVEIVELSFPDMMPAFANSNIDAAHTSEPFSTLAAERGIATKWRSTAEYAPGVAPAVLTYAPHFVQGAADLGQRFLVAYLRGARDYNTALRSGVGRADIVQILTKHTAVKDPALYDRMGLSYIDPDGALNLASLADQVAFYHDFGAIPSPVDVSSLVDNRFREAALQRLGPYRAP